jgi:prephenate dehydratase
MPKSIRMFAFQGEPGAFSHSAALKLLGSRAKPLPCASFRDVFQAVQTGSADCAVVPIENTLHGSVHENYDYLMEYDLVISGETSIRISHQLIAMPGTKLSRVKRVLSHPVALNQCKRFFHENEKLEAVSFYDTAGSVKAIKEGCLPETAAIASETAASIYGGIILRRNIEDIRENFTRFFLMTKQPTKVVTASGQRKTSVVFSTANTPGSLFRALSCFALRDLNMTKVESRPLRGKPWEYLFYVDFLGSLDEKKTENALENLKECSQFVKLLGSYTPTP